MVKTYRVVLLPQAVITVYEDELRVEVVDIDHGADDPQRLIERFS